MFLCAVYLPEDRKASRQFVEFLKNFYDVFPEYKNVEVSGT